MTAVAVKQYTQKTLPIPKTLVYEELNGRKLYRKDYKKFLNHTKTIIALTTITSMLPQKWSLK